MKESHGNNPFQDHSEAILTGFAHPKNPEEQQAFMIEEYFMRYRSSIGTPVTPEEFNDNNDLQMEAVMLWKQSGMAAAYRKMLNDPNKPKPILESTLDDIGSYIDHN
jgi:hypothetical protein